VHVCSLDDRLTAGFFLQGNKGGAGANGLKGQTGANGLKGEVGTGGSKGDAGSGGAKGQTGAEGKAGTPGTPGTKGTTGAEGAQGAEGAKGDTGADHPTDAPTAAPLFPGWTSATAYRWADDTAGVTSAFGGAATGTSFCAATTNDNTLSVVNQLIPANSEFRFQVQSSGYGISFGFAFADSIGQGITDFNYPENKVSTVPRVGISQHPPGSIFYEWKDMANGRFGGNVAGRGIAEDMNGGQPFASTDVITIFRSLQETAGICIIYIEKNGVIVKTANTHEWGLPDGGCGPGYIWLGHYNSASDKQCLTNMELRTTQCVSPGINGSPFMDCANP
jgi:hypothetical protein